MLNRMRIHLIIVIITGSTLIGFGVGYFVSHQNVSFLEGVKDQQNQELQSLYATKATIHQRNQQLLVDLATVTSDYRTNSAILDTLSAELQATSSALEVAETRLSEGLVTTNASDSSLNQAQVDIEALKEVILRMESETEGIEDALSIQAELQNLLNDKLKPLLGDGTLLFQQGLRAVENSNFTTAATYFEESGNAFTLAKQQAQRLATRQKDLVLIIPQDLRREFVLSQKISEASVFLTDAQGIAYSAAGPLYRVVGEWQTSQSKDPNDLNRWRTLIQSSDVALEQALGLLEEADKWAPGVWRQFEAIRIEIRRIQGLSATIRNLILGESG